MKGRGGVGGLVRVAHGVGSCARVSGLWWTKTKVATGNNEVQGGRARAPEETSTCA